LPHSLEHQTCRGCSRRYSIPQLGAPQTDSSSCSALRGVDSPSPRSEHPGDRDDRRLHDWCLFRLVRLDDGTHLDVLRWESREAADAAIEKLPEIPEAGEIHDLLSGGDLAHHRGEVVGG
jgi:hypothetical protein